MRHPRFFPALFFLMFLPVLLLAQEAVQESTPVTTADAPLIYREGQEKEYKFYPGGRIGISLEVPGNLKIIGWERGSVRMEAEKIIHGLPAEQAREFLKKPPIRVRYTDAISTIQVAGVQPAGGALEVNLTVYVPKMRTDLTVQLNKGDLSIDTVNGWIEATMAEGNMTLTALDGYFSGKTLKGNIRADMVGRQWRGLGFTAATRAGDIELVLPEIYDAALQLDTRNGTISVDYPPQEVEGELMPPDIVIQKTAQQLKATIGDGGAPLRLGTELGNVSLTKK